MLLATIGSFGAFGLMTIAIGTDYWMYSKARICNTTNGSQQEAPQRDRKDLGSLTHSGLWRVCCLEGIRRGVCQKINHFPEDTDYDHDSAEYLLRVVRASSIFPILSALLLLLGGVCIASSRFYRSKRNIVLGSGILFVAAGLSNIIGVIVYISANAGDPSTRRDEDKKFHYHYGWSFYFGGLSFILAEVVGVLAVNVYIERSREARCLPPFLPAPHTIPRTLHFPPPPPQLPPPSASPPSAGDISLFTLSRGPSKATLANLLGSERETGFMALQSCFGGGGGGGGGEGGKEGEGGTLNRKTTPV